MCRKIKQPILYRNKCYNNPVGYIQDIFNIHYGYLTCADNSISVAMLGDKGVANYLGLLIPDLTRIF